MESNQDEDGNAYGFIPTDMTIKDIVEGTELQILAWDINNRSPRLFTKWAYDNIGENNDKVDSKISLLEMTWASANTPMYFTPAVIDGKFYISGDNAARSPAMYSYLHGHFLGEKRVKVISIGSTNEMSSIQSNESPISWFSKAFDLGMPVKVHTMDYMTDHLIRSNGTG